jgi:PAS domain S-box-containing protein
MLPLERLDHNFPRLKPGSPAAYATAVALVGVSLLLRLWLARWVAEAPLMLFLPAIIAAAFLGGGGAGLLAVALSAAAAWWFLLSDESFLVHLNSLALFVLVGVINVVAIGALRRAVSKVKRLNRTLTSSEERFRRMIESAPDAMVIADEQGRIALVNAQAEKLFGYQRNELIGQSVELLIPRPVAQGHRAHMAAYMARPTARPMGGALDLHGRRKDGTEIPVEISLSPLQTENGMMVSSAIRDISQRRRIEHELARARQEEQAASRAKSDFLSSMSHELRTPLNAVIGFAQILEMEGADILTARQREYLDYIRSGGEHLLKLVNEVLDLSKIEAGRLNLAVEPINVFDALEQIHQTMVPIADKAGIRFDLLLPEEIADVKADRLRLHQVLLNLVSNAIKYNRPGGRVAVTARAAADDRIEFVVTDTGLGISPQRQKDLFQPFQRLGAEHSAIEGTGLGLSLSRRLVEAMGGTIGLTSEPGQGSRVWFELPSEPGTQRTSHSAAAAPAVLPGAQARTYSLLHIDDNPISIRLMESIIRTLPQVRMMSAGTPQLGLEIAKAHRPDIILLDLHLPEMDGFQVLAKLKEMAETRDIPVLALTASAYPGDIKRGLTAGFFRYLTKPIDIKALFTAIDEALLESSERRSATG